MGKHTVQTATVGEEEATLVMTPRQARVLHRLLAQYNIGLERNGSETGRLEPQLEDALLRLVAFFLNERR